MVKKILKINLPLSENSLYVEISDENRSISEILTDVANELKNQGRFHESQQIFAYLTDQNYKIYDIIEEKKNSLKNESKQDKSTDHNIIFRLE